MQRERWGSRWGVILAVAGSAVGLGNFLRFPGYAASMGGGAFMIPYLVALVLVGLPLVWMEWSLGRFGGSLGHGTAPALLEAASGRKVFRYLGVMGVFGPFAILVYYTLIESWTLGFAWHSLVGNVAANATKAELGRFFGEFRTGNGVYVFLAATFLANLFVIGRGVRGGIEKLCRLGMPLLVLLALFLLLRTATFRPAEGGRTWGEGLAWLWRPDFAKLGSFRVWLTAAGQIFYTLSVGIGVILTYASYVGRDDDIAGSGLAAAGTNEFIEVVLAGSIVIPLAFMIYGGAETQAIAAGSVFDLAFVSLPLAFQGMPLGTVALTAWFALLFLAALTSSVSLAQPCVAFLQDELGFTRRRATIALGVAYGALLVPLSLLWARGWLGEFDFWAGVLLLVVFGLVETVFFGWVMGVDRGFEELSRGARIRVPRVFRFVMRYVSPLYLLFLLVGYLATEWWDQIVMKDVPAADAAATWAARAVLVLLFAGTSALAWVGARRRARGRGFTEPQA